MKKRDLINIIENLDSFEKPKIDLEQYQTDAISTADIIFHIAFENGDLDKSLLVDLGCGTGNLSIATALLGVPVISFDIDKDALKIFKKNIENLGVEDSISIQNADILDISKEDVINLYDLHFNNQNNPTKIPMFEKIVVLTNPPFGVHNKGIDVKFLIKAMEIGDIIYSIHLYNQKSLDYLEKIILDNNGLIKERSKLQMTLKHSYEFHKKKSKSVETVVFKIEKN